MTLLVEVDSVIACSCRRLLRVLLAIDGQEYNHLHDSTFQPDDPREQSTDSMILIQRPTHNQQPKNANSQQEHQFMIIR